MIALPFISSFPRRHRSRVLVLSSYSIHLNDQFMDDSHNEKTKMCTTTGRTKRTISSILGVTKERNVIICCICVVSIMVETSNSIGHWPLATIQYITNRVRNKKRIVCSRLAGGRVMESAVRNDDDDDNKGNGMWLEPDEAHCWGGNKRRRKEENGERKGKESTTDRPTDSEIGRRRRRRRKFSFPAPSPSRAHVRSDSMQVVRLKAKQEEEDNDDGVESWDEWMGTSIHCTALNFSSSLRTKKN